jgi:hypothetical protein
MRYNRVLLLVALICCLAAGCGGGGGGGDDSGAAQTQASAQPAVEANVLAVTVNGSLCSSATSSSYANKPCVSVTVCSPGTSNCQTISDILLDTGDYGLRIFKQVLTVPLEPVASGSGSLGECITYGGGLSLWGSVQMADVKLGGEPPCGCSMLVVDTGFRARCLGLWNARREPVGGQAQRYPGLGVLQHRLRATCENHHG